MVILPRGQGRPWRPARLALAVGLILIVAGWRAAPKLLGLLAAWPPSGTGARVVAPRPDPPPAVADLPTPLVLGYVDGSAPTTSLGAGPAGTVLNGVVPDWYTMTATGRVAGEADPLLLDEARMRGLVVLALVQNNARPAALEAMLASPQARRRARAALVDLCLADGYAGVNLDFEGLSPKDRAAYLSFLRPLARALHRYGLILSLSVPAETPHLGAGTWDGAYPYRALGRVADLLFLMAYDLHWPGSAPGAVASTAWVAQVVRYAASQVPPDRLVLGLPAYGYDWTLGGNLPAVPLTYAQAMALARTYGRSPDTGHFTYRVRGVTHVVYFESPQAFVAQARVAVVYGLRGLVIWRLGIEAPAIWPALRLG